MPNAPKVTYGTSYQDALAMLQGTKEQPSVVFCQFKNLSGSSGAHVYEYMRSLGEKFGDVPFVFMSANPEVLDVGKRLRVKDPHVFAISSASLSYRTQLAGVIQELGALHGFNRDQIQRELFSLLPSRRQMVRYKPPIQLAPRKRDLGYRDILVVDDEPHNARLAEVNLGQILEGPLTIKKIPNGKEAVAYFQEAENKPDLILMDEKMPFMNGSEAIQAIREYERDTNAELIALGFPSVRPVQFLLVTASPERFEELCSREPGLSVIVEKPWTPQNLETGLRSLEPIAEARTRLLEYMKEMSPEELASNETLVLDLLTSSLSYKLDDEIRRNFVELGLPAVVGRPLRYDELSLMYAAILNRDPQFIERVNDYSDTHKVIFEELYKNPAKADFVFNAAFRMRIVLDKYSTDEAIVPGLERSWYQVKKGGFADLVKGDPDEMGKDVIAIMRKAFHERPKSPDGSIEYPHLNNPSDASDMYLFGMMVMSAMEAVVAKEGDLSSISDSDLQMVYEYTLHRASQRQFDTMSSIQDPQVVAERKQVAKFAVERSKRLDAVMDRLVSERHLLS